MNAKEIRDLILQKIGELVANDEISLNGIIITLHIHETETGHVAFASNVRDNEGNQSKEIEETYMQWLLNKTILVPENEITQ